MDKNAFPEIKSEADSTNDYYVTRVYSEGGLTKLEYFFASILGGMCARGLHEPPQERIDRALLMAAMALHTLEKK